MHLGTVESIPQTRKCVPFELEMYPRLGMVYDNEEMGDMGGRSLFVFS